MLNEYKLAPANGRPAERVVLFLHGLGDNGQGGLLSIGELWQSALPDCEFICPDAPFAFDMAPPEFGGRQWFSLREFTPAVMLAGAKNAAPYLNDAIDQILTTRHLTPDRLALVGFSQGTIMALYVAPRRTPSLAGILGYSGLLVGGDTLADEKKSTPPILLIHGKQDAVVAHSALQQAELGLKAAGFDVSTHSCPDLGHSIDEVGIAKGLQFLKKIWAI